jgi:hypothetical protein
MRCNHVPDCAITLYYYRSLDGSSSSFSYYCKSSSQGWTVQSNGSIHPPSRQRIVRIDLDAFPRDPKFPAVFAGFRMGLMEYPFQMSDSYWTPWGNLESLGVKPLIEGYPTENTTDWWTSEPLVFDMTEARGRLAYSLAVRVGDSDPDWDDPKIYDDGSQ